MLSLLTSLKSQLVDYSEFKKLLLDKHKKEDIAPGLDTVCCGFQFDFKFLKLYMKLWKA